MSYLGSFSDLCWFFLLSRIIPIITVFINACIYFLSCFHANFLLSMFHTSVLYLVWCIHYILHVSCRLVRWFFMPLFLLNSFQMSFSSISVIFRWYYHLSEMDALLHFSSHLMNFFLNVKILILFYFHSFCSPY